jgi:hypothetical protein
VSKAGRYGDLTGPVEWTPAFLLSGETRALFAGVDERFITGNADPVGAVLRVGGARA